MTTVRKLATAMAVSLALASTGVQALGLGDIEMHSALNQPLDADIGLTSVQPGELEGLLVQLASREAFERAGIERSAALTALKFSVERNADGDAYIKVGSNGPVVEPFLNFLLEVDWPKGRMVREYTILLDPPVFMNQEAVSSTGTTTAPEVPSQQLAEQDPAVPVAIDRASDETPIDVAVGENANTEVADNEVIPADDDIAIAEEVIIDSITISSDTEIEVKPDAVAAAPAEPVLLDGVRNTGTDAPVAGTSTQQPSPSTPEAVAEPSRNEIETASAAGDTYTVIRNDTLWQIALDAKPSDVSVQQMMLALLQANQEAFVDNNVNRLKAGAILRMPSYDEILVRDRRQAIAEMTEQNSLWQEYRDSIGRSTAATQQPAASDVEETTAVESAPAETAGTETPAETVAEKVDALTAEASESATSAVEETAGQAESVTEAAQGAVEEAAETAGDELKIVADPATTESAATAAADEAEQPENAVLGQINTDLTLAREELEAQNLQKEELQAQASEIEDNKDKMERLVELRENELAQLQKQLAEAEEAAQQAAAETAAAEEAAKLAEAEGAAANETESEAAETAAVEQEAEATVEPALVDEPPIVVETPEPEQTFIQKLLADPMKAAGVGLGALGLLGFLGWLLTRGRKKDEEEVVVAEPEAFAEETAVDTQAEFSEVSAVEDETIELAEMPEPEELPEIIEGDDTGIEGLDDTGLLSGAVDDESSKDDTISEADVYLAYGLHGQAEDLLTKAVDREPQNQEYHLKLLETHHGQKNPESFASVAQNFHSNFGGDSNPEWSRVAEMGRDIDPENALFAESPDTGSSTAVAAGTAAAAVAGLGVAEAFSESHEEDSTLALDGFDGTGDVTEIIAPPGEEEAAADLQDESLLDQSIDPGLAFDEADLEATGDFSKVAEEINAEEISAETEDLAADIASIDGSSLLDGDSLLDDVEELDIDNELSLDSPETVEEVGEQVVAEADDLSSLLDELGGEATEESGSARVLSAANDAMEVESLNETLSGLEDTGLDFEESVLDLSSLGDDNLVDEGIEGLELTGTPEELTLDLEELGEGVAEADSSVENMFDHTETLDTAFDQTQELEIPDLTANTDLTGSEETAAFGGTNEMETMLDLAKAYIDMGDNDSASSALNEIVKGGTEEQKNTAEQLLKKIG